MISLEKKKILLFAPKFFNYEIAIKDEMERQGADVHLYDERNNPSSVEKILLRKAHFLMESKISQYYSYICEKEKDYNPDYNLFLFHRYNYNIAKFSIPSENEPCVEEFSQQKKDYFVHHINEHLPPAVPFHLL